MNFDNVEAGLAHEWVEKELAKRVCEIPFGSNRGPRVEFYQRHDFLLNPDTGYAWCVDLWLTAWEEGAGRKLPYLSPGAYDLMRWAVKHDWDTNRPTRGAGVCFNIGSGHWGTFDSFDGEFVVTIDGNSGPHCVVRKRRHKSLVRGYMLPPSVLRPLPPKATKKPLFVVATSENGNRDVIYVGGATAVGNKIAQILKNHNHVTITKRKKKVKT
jgi:hypothetical protein